jgi:hypothetical protein
LRTATSEKVDAAPVKSHVAAITNIFMQAPTDQEKAAIEAVFSFQRVIDVPRRDAHTRKAKTPRNKATAVVEVPRRAKSTIFPKLKEDTAEIWAGWRFVGDELIDGGGKRYGKSEIRAIFYNRGLLRMYKSELERLRHQRRAGDAALSLAKQAIGIKPFSWYLTLVSSCQTQVHLPPVPYSKIYL